MSIPTLKHNISNKGKLNYSTMSVRRFLEGKNLICKLIMDIDFDIFLETLRM